jgi:hypothetical protein
MNDALRIGLGAGGVADGIYDECVYVRSSEHQGRKRTLFAAAGMREGVAAI